MGTVFEQALEIVFKHEGVLSDDVLDKGGLTKYGISSRAYPDVDIRALTKEQAGDIYYRDYWRSSKAHLISSPEVATLVFDIAVNSGVRNSGYMVQRAILAHGTSISLDGLVGRNTLAEINNIGNRLLPTLISERVGFYKRIVARSPSQKRFLKGWLRRAYSFA